VTEEEIRAYFDANRERIGQRPPSITFRQVVLPIEPSDSAREATRLKADSILQLARSGEDFAQLARRFSEDPGSRDLGGDLGYNRFETWYAEFSSAVFSPQVRPGEIFGPVRTPVGFHVIKLERVRGPERQVRHILLRPTITADDRARARQRGDSIAAAIREGTSVDSLAARYSDPEELVRIGPWRQDSLPTPYDQHLATAREGDVIGPFEIDAEGPQPQLAIVRVTSTEPARPATVDDYRVQIQQQIAQTKLMEELIQELRRATYIDIRMPAIEGAVGATR
jgi:peptidyl-prolyl cis-trans isomerase SurA